MKTFENYVNEAGEEKFVVGKKYRSYPDRNRFWEVIKRTDKQITVREITYSDRGGQVLKHNIYGGYFEPEWAYVVGNNRTSNALWIAADEPMGK